MSGSGLRDDKGTEKKRSEDALLLGLMREEGDRAEDVSDIWKPERARKWIVPWSLHKEPAQPSP